MNYFTTIGIDSNTSRKEFIKAIKIAKKYSHPECTIIFTNLSKDSEGANFYYKDLKLKNEFDEMFYENKIAISTIQNEDLVL